MIISVLSGKGGTGKTTVAVNLALTLEKSVVLLDCDVEEPNAGIFLKPEFQQSQSVMLPVPWVEEDRCDYCGYCREVCAYNAIVVIPPESPAKKGGVLIFSHLCHGCGACVLLCPRQAMGERPRDIGLIEIGKAGQLKFVQGRIKVGEVLSPFLIKAVKQQIEPELINIIDCPPGTSCPVIAAVRGSDFALLVTEPTPFGLHDLSLAVELLEKLKISAGVIINRCDLGDMEVEKFCRDQGLPVLLRIPFSREIAAGYSRGKPLIRVLPGYEDKFRELYAGILRELQS